MQTLRIKLFISPWVAYSHLLNNITHDNGNLGFPFINSLPIVKDLTNTYLMLSSDI